MLTTSALITAIGNAIVNDAALTTWCTATFGAGVTVYEGDPTDDIDAPAVAILEVSGNDRSEGRREISRGVLIGCAVSNATIVTSGRKKSCTGMHQAETMREMVENAVLRANLGQTVSVEFGKEPDARHPLYIVYTAITIAELKTTRNRLPG